MKVRRGRHIEGERRLSGRGKRESQNERKVKNKSLEKEIFYKGLKKEGKEGIRRKKTSVKEKER